MKIVAKSGDYVIFLQNSYLLLPICLAFAIMGLIIIPIAFPIGFVFIGIAVLSVMFIPSKTLTTVNLLGVEIERTYWFGKKKKIVYEHTTIEKCVNKLDYGTDYRSRPGGFFIRVKEDYVVRDVSLFQLSGSKTRFGNSVSTKQYISKDKKELMELIPIILRKSLEVEDSAKTLSQGLDGIREKAWSTLQDKE